jgi:hypothetical protein
MEREDVPSENQTTPKNTLDLQGTERGGSVSPRQLRRCYVLGGFLKENHNFP